MDAGFSTLEALKAQVLPSPLQDSSDYDTLLLSLGLGLVRRFERHCNRPFRRVADSVYEVPGDSRVVTLPLYPVETISTVEMRDNYAAAYTEAADAICSLSDKSGVLVLAELGANYLGSIRITYTGGYWHDATGADTLPSGATEIEADLLNAWHLQARHVFANLDLNGEHMHADSTSGSRLAALDLLPDVLETLRPYRKFG